MALAEHVQQIIKAVFSMGIYMFPDAILFLRSVEIVFLFFEGILQQKYCICIFYTNLLCTCGLAIHTDIIVLS